MILYISFLLVIKQNNVLCFLLHSHRLSPLKSPSHGGRDQTLPSRGEKDVLRPGKAPAHAFGPNGIPSAGSTGPGAGHRDLGEAGSARRALAPPRCAYGVDADPSTIHIRNGVGRGDHRVEGVEKCSLLLLHVLMTMEDPTCLQ